MQLQRPENGSSPRPGLRTSARALHVVALALCACSGARDKPTDAAAAPVPEAAVDAAVGDDAARPVSPMSGKQIIRMTPGHKIGRIALGMSLVDLESLARDWSKEELDGGTISLRKSPWHVLLKDGVAHEMTFTLDATILPVVANRTVPDSTVMSDVAKIFPDCQAPTVEDGLDLITCQGGQTRLERKGVDGNIVVRFVTLPPPKTKAKRPAAK